MKHDKQESKDASMLIAGQVGRLVMLRWLSVGAMLLSALALPPMLGLSVPLGPLLSVALAMAAANLFSLAVLGAGIALPPRLPFFQLGVDILGWSAFLYFAGGATNPLISLLLPLVAIGAMALPPMQAWAIAGMAVLAYSLLWNFNHPIRLADAAMAAHWHLSGMWLTFTLSACVIVGFLLRMTSALRAQERALADAREARVRDERIVALGNLAAGAAHNLGTPLGTLRILVDELRADERIDPGIRADVDLMSDQIDHCKQTLAMLTASAGNRRAEGGGACTVRTWLEGEIARWREQRPHARAILACSPLLDDLEIVVDDTLGQAVHTMINNAADACPDPVEIEAGVSDASLFVEVRDRGPGITEALRGSLGNTPLEDRPAGMGIGLFLARAALERHEGGLSFGVRPGGGTVARMELPLERIQT
jgi:two-component system, sensor histidine kinase RegB